MRLTDNRYENIKQIVVNMFTVNDIRRIPIDCFEICQKMCIKLRKYSGLTEGALIKAKEVSEDGFCMLLKEGPAPFESYQWYIFYDDTKSRERIRFTIMHEIGHIVLEHTEHSELAESEANFFAKYSLAPPPLVNKIKPEDYMDIAEAFDLSQECAYYAMSFIISGCSMAVQSSWTMKFNYFRCLIKPFNYFGGDVYMCVKKKHIKKLLPATN